MQNKKILTLSSVFVGLFVFVALNGQASAATLTVSGGCTLPEAVNAMNAGADENGCVKTGEAYGTEDTITIPSGTQTITADMPAINTSVVISGAGKTQTILDFDGNLGFTNLDNAFSDDITIEDLQVTGADTYGIRLFEVNNLVIEDVIVTDSDKGVSVSNNKSVIIKNSTFQNNDYTHVSEDVLCGLSVSVAAPEQDDIPTALIEGVIVRDNDCSGGNTATNAAGLFIGVNDGTYPGGGYPDNLVASHKVTIRNTSVVNNTAEVSAGINVVNGSGPVSTVKVDLLIDATTVANNDVVADQAIVAAEGEAHSPAVSGMYISVNLEDQHTLTNVTVANNKVELLDGDNRNAISGFWGVLPFTSGDLKITNVTIVGNNLTQPDRTVSLSAFMVVKVDLDLSGYPTIVVNDFTGGSSSLNGLIAQNTTNDEVINCSSSIDVASLVVGASGEFNSTPENLGHNMSNDQSCAGYDYQPTLWDTIEHEIADNGGPVPTIKLLPGSPAINGGGQVLGISTDARGIARSGYYSVGAYQGVLLAATTTEANNLLANTGVLAVSSTLLVGIIIAVFTYTYFDYRKHKKPLVLADPDARHTYTYAHHVRSVSIPLLKYRINFSLQKAPNTDNISKF